MLKAFGIGLSFAIGVIVLALTVPSPRPLQPAIEDAGAWLAGLLVLLLAVVIAWPLEDAADDGDQPALPKSRLPQ
jgi:hypothetical protein